MPLPSIPATSPVVAPAAPSVTYNSWALTELIVEASVHSAPTNVILRRCGLDSSGNTVLMPLGPNATTTFNLDIIKEAATTPDLGAAMGAVLSAIIEWATAKNLL